MSRVFTDFAPDVDPSGNAIFVGGGLRYYKYTFNTGSLTTINVFVRTNNWAGEEMFYHLSVLGSSSNVFVTPGRITNLSNATWDSTNGRVQITVNNLNNTSATPNFTINNLQTNTTYYLIVQTLYNDGGMDLGAAFENGATVVPLTYVATDTTTTSLIEPRPPGAPTGVVGIPGPNSVRLTWNPPASDGGAPITSYTVSWSGVTTGTQTGIVGTSAVIGNLVAFAPYTFVVRAVNSEGTGAASAASAPVIPEQSYRGRIIGINGTAMIGNAMRIC